MVQQIAKVAIPVRRPISEVFNAFVEPSLITKFWLKSTSGALAEGATVQWHFMVPGAVETVTVRDFQVNRRLAFGWLSGVSVVMSFTDRGPATTHLSVEASGFKDGDIEAVVSTTEGFSIVLCDLKTLLESGHSANLVRDKAELIAESQVHGSSKREA